MLKLGLFADENGKLNASTKARLFEILGFGNWEDGRSNDEIHRKKALKENMELEKKDVPVDVYDDHALHIAEHVRMCVSTKCVSDKAVRDRVANHIAKHTELASLVKGVENMQRQFDESADKERV